MKRKDIGILLSIDETGPSVRMPTDTKNRLIKKGMIDGEKNLTENGIEIVETVKEKLVELRSGISFQDRNGIYPDRILESRKEWLAFSMNGKRVFTDKSIIVAGLPEKKMVVNRNVNMATVSKVTVIMAKALHSDCTEIEPVVFQTDGVFGGIEVVWMRYTDPSVDSRWIAIQAMYYDYVMSKHRKSKWFAPVAYARNAPVQARLASGGLTRKHVVALLLPFDTGPNWPRVIGGGRGDEEKMSD